MINQPSNLSTKLAFLVNKLKAVISPNTDQTTPSFSQQLMARSCYLCDETVDTSHRICSACTDDLPCNREHCLTCALPMETNYGEPICADCIKKAPPYHGVIAPFTYAFPIDSCIKAIKYRNQAYYLRALSPFLVERIKQTDATVDLIIPVPMHRRKFRERGANQAELLAELVSKDLNIPLNRNALRKIKVTDAQAGLKKKERLANLQSSFKCTTKLTGQRIALVDDVVTTGATIETLSNLLLSEGARSVEVWCLARTPK